MKQKYYNELFENFLEKMFHLILCVKFAMTVYVSMCVSVCVLCSMCSGVFVLCIWLFLYRWCCFCKFCWENWNAQTIAPAMQLTHLVNVRYLYALQHALRVCKWIDMGVLNGHAYSRCELEKDRRKFIFRCKNETHICTATHSQCNTQAAATTAAACALFSPLYRM